MRKVYVGIDLGSKKCSGAAIDSRGELLDCEQFETSEGNLIRFVKKQKGEVRVLVEECDMAGWVLRTLLPHTQSVEVSEPRFNSWIHKAAVKNDPTDALKLARLLRMGSYIPVWHPSDQDMVALKSAVKAYEEIVRICVASMSRIKAHLRQQGIVVEGKRVFGGGRSEVLLTIPHPISREILVQDFRIFDQLQKERARARCLMISLSQKFPITNAFTEVPGVGPIGAARFVAYVQTPHRFSSKRRLWRYCRLGVVDRESSGKPLSRKHLDRAGNGALKDLSRKAFEASVRRRDNNLFKRSYLKSLERSGNPTHARLATQRKILAVMLAMWKDGTRYEDRVAKEGLTAA